jgi:hypothetical protein
MRSHFYTQILCFKNKDIFKLDVLNHQTIITLNNIMHSFSRYASFKKNDYNHYLKRKNSNNKTLCKITTINTLKE